MIKHLKFMIQLIGRFAFVSGQQFYNEINNDYTNSAEILYSKYNFEVFSKNNFLNKNFIELNFFNL